MKIEELNKKEKLREYQRKWKKNRYWNNPSYRKTVIQIASKYSKISASRIRREVLEHYGGSPPKCFLCEILDYEVLDIDHIFGNGSYQRRKENLRGSKFYYWLKRRNFPKGYRVLCRNCNWKENLKRKGEKIED
jgi:hypothetical protein